MPDDTARRALRRRFWIESGLAIAAAVLAVVTLINAEWIEAVSGFEPDGGNGALEWLIVAALAAAAVVFGLGARAEWRRSVPARPQAS